MEPQLGKVHDGKSGQFHIAWRLDSSGNGSDLRQFRPAISASGAPDLSVVVKGPSAAGINSPFTERATITNRGTATAQGITVSYTTGGPAIRPVHVPGLYCTYVERGHSGRGGGFTIVGDRCSESLSRGLAPGHRITVAMTMSEASVRELGLLSRHQHIPQERSSISFRTRPGQRFRSSDRRQREPRRASRPPSPVISSTSAGSRRRQLHPTSAHRLSPRRRSEGLVRRC